MRWRLALVLTLGLVGGLPARVHAAPDPREIEAREEFAAERYQTALEIFARLYAETLHPNYLRNIARCYQNLGEPDRAITSFRDYLHKGRSISPDERVEIEGYIKEMEDLKRARAAAAAGAAPVSAPPAAKAPTLAIAAPSAPRAASVDLTASAPPPKAVGESEESPPVYERWWFWAVVVGVAGAGVGVAAAAGAFTHYDNPPCRDGYTCSH
jgi:hypothetical protein